MTVAFLRCVQIFLLTYFTGSLVVGGILPPSGSRIAELKSKDATSRQLMNSTRDIPCSDGGASDVNSAETRTERGPRIKHVCRRAAVVFGERATFPFLPSPSQPSPEINLSALPSHEKKHVVQQSAEGLLPSSFVAVLFSWNHCSC